MKFKDKYHFLEEVIKTLKETDCQEELSKTGNDISFKWRGANPSKSEIGTYSTHHFDVHRDGKKIGSATAHDESDNLDAHKVDAPGAKLRSHIQSKLQDHLNDNFNSYRKKSPHRMGKE